MLFRSRIATIATATDPTGATGTDGIPRRQRVVIMPGHFTDDGTIDPQGIGHQELYDSVGIRTYYSNSTDYTPPTVTNISGERTGDTVTVHATAADTTNTVARVAVMVDPGLPDAEWTLIEAHLSAGEWVGSGRLPAGAVQPQIGRAHV